MVASKLARSHKIGLINRFVLRSNISKVITTLSDINDMRVGALLL